MGSELLTEIMIKMAVFECDAVQIGVPLLVAHSVSLH